MQELTLGSWSSPPYLAPWSAVAHHFDEETRIEPLDENRWRVNLSGNWNIGDNPNGGYLLAPLQRAMQEASGHPDPLTVTTHYLRPGEIGEGIAEVEVVRSGRTIGTMRGRLVQNGKTKIEAIAAYTDLTVGNEVADVSVPAPLIPPPEDCPPRTQLAQGVHLPIMDRVDVRIHPDHILGATGRQPLIDGWIRFADERPVDAAALTLFADAFPPPLFALVGRIGWVPTIELTVQVRRRPVDGWIQGRFRTSDAAATRTIEDGHLWDSSGRLVALSRQVGLVLSAS
ncbi:MAG: thioesterase family protein [Actinomycetota bacterium]